MNTEQAKQLRLAATIIETGHPWEYNHDKDFWQKPSGTSVLFAVSEGWPIRLAFATPPDGRALHNPDSLTAEQVGAGWRLLAQGELKIPHAEFWATNEEWTRSTSESTFSNQTYRVPRSVPWPEAPKPFQLPPLPPGMQWHREDGWKAGDLPQGWRPLVEGEKIGVPIGPSAVPFRTSRPLTFEHAGKQWTWHRPGDPMPCDGERMVHVLISDDLADDPPLQARQIEWNREDAGDVIGWRYADADEKKTVPLEPEDVPPGSVFRSKDQPATQFWTVTQVWDGGFYLRGDNVEWDVAMQRMEINRSIPLTGKWDASAWEPCSKQI